MRVVKTETGRQFFVRGLTRGEVKALRSEGIELTNLSPERAEDALDAVLAKVLSEHDLAEVDDMPNRVAMDIWSAALIETYGSRDEEKNSSRSGNGSRTATESSTASNAAN